MPLPNQSVDEKSGVILTGGHLLRPDWGQSAHRLDSAFDQDCQQQQFNTYNDKIITKLAALA